MTFTTSTRFFPRRVPQLSNPKDDESAYVASIKDQHYFPSGELLETGFAFNQYNTRYTPYGTSPYFVNTDTTGGNYYLTRNSMPRAGRGSPMSICTRSMARPPRLQVRDRSRPHRLRCPFLPPPISFLTDNNRLTTPDLCFTAPQDKNFPCTRYSTFTAAPLHEQFNNEVSAYLEDRWSVTNRFLIEPGVRLDWDSMIHRSDLSPRLAATYVLDNSGNTKLSAGIGLDLRVHPHFSDRPSLRRIPPGHFLLH